MISTGLFGLTASAGAMTVPPYTAEADYLLNKAMDYIATKQVVLQLT